MNSAGPSGPPCELETLAGGVPETGVAPKPLLSKLAPAARVSDSFLVSPALHVRSQLQMPPRKLPSLRTSQGQSWVGRGERRSLKSLFPRWERALGLGGKLYLSGSQSRDPRAPAPERGPQARAQPRGPRAASWLPSPCVSAWLGHIAGVQLLGGGFGVKLWSKQLT